MQALSLKPSLRDLRPAPDPTPSSDKEDIRVDLQGGAHLRVVHSTDGATVLLFSPSAEPVLEYRVATGEVRITGPVCRVDLEASEGGLALSSRGDISLRAEGTVRLQGKAGVRIEAADIGKAAASVHVSSAGVTLAGHRLGIVGAEGSIRLRRCDVAGDEVRSTWSRATLTAKRLEFAAHDMSTRVHSLVQTVEETLTSRAGRLREWIRGSRHSHAETTEILSEKDVRIDGSKIYLG